MTRRPATSLFASPVLVGAVTVLVAIVGVFLAYNANSGLPFVPSYEIRAAVPDASELTPGNDVRIGGTRVGQVSAIHADERDGRPVAVLELQLEEAVRPLRADTRLQIRQRSNVGLKYVELRPGRVGAPLPENAMLALERAGRPVDLDDALNVYDAPTRTAVRGIVNELGSGLAGRGGDLNRSLARLPGLLEDMEGVARSLRSRRTDLAGLVDGAADAAATLAPVAEPLGRLFDSGATTLDAIARQGDAFGAVFDETAALGRDGTRAFGALNPVLAEATLLAREAAPGAELLPVASERLAAALRRSEGPVARARKLAPPLGATVASLRALAREPDTTGALERLTDVVRPLRPTLEHFNPIQTRCNALGIWTRNVPSVVSEGDQSGTWFRFVPIQKLDESRPRADPAPDLHYYTIPDAGQQGECEAGNESYVRPDSRVVGRVPGRQPGFTEDTPRGTLFERVAAEGSQR